MSSECTNCRYDVTSCPPFSGSQAFTVNTEGAGRGWEILSWKTSSRTVNTRGYVVPNEKSLVRSVQVLEVDSINWETAMMSSEFLTQCYGNQILSVGRSKADGCAFKVWKKSEVLSTCRSYRPQKDTESVRSTCALKIYWAAILEYKFGAVVAPLAFFWHFKGPPTNLCNHTKIITGYVLSNNTLCLYAIRSTCCY